LAANCLRSSSDLTRSDTDMFNSRIEQILISDDRPGISSRAPFDRLRAVLSLSKDEVEGWIGTYLVLLRIEIAAFHPPQLPMSSHPDNHGDSSLWL